MKFSLVVFFDTFSRSCSSEQSFELSLESALEPNTVFVLGISSCTTSLPQAEVTSTSLVFQRRNNGHLPASHLTHASDSMSQSSRHSSMLVQTEDSYCFQILSKTSPNFSKTENKFVFCLNCLCTNFHGQNSSEVSAKRSPPNSGEVELSSSIPKTLKRPSFQKLAFGSYRNVMVSYQNEFHVCPNMLLRSSTNSGVFQTQLCKSYN